MAERAPFGRLATAIAIDTAIVVLFVAVGRGSHDEGSGMGAVLSIAAPFLLALWLGWLSLYKDDPTSVATGLLVWVQTVAFGMLLRRFMFSRGTAVSFIIVTALFLGALMLGWRLAARWRDRRSTRSA